MSAVLRHFPEPPQSDVMAGLQAIAEPTRARIVALLSHGEHCVCDVGSMLVLSPALVSHHLRVLRASGLLRERRSGRWVYYSLDVDALGRLRAALTGLLTPGDEAATACLCSDCGAGASTRAPGVSLPDIGRLSGIPS